MRPRTMADKLHWTLWVVAILGCSSDSGPTAVAPHLAATKGLAESCDTGCVVFADTRAFWAAHTNPDSSDHPIHLASLQAVGEAGGTIALALEADDLWLATLPVSAEVGVEIDGVRRGVPLKALRSPLVVHRFQTKGEVRLRLLLRREYTQVQPAGVRLLLQAGGVLVRDLAVPWRPSGAVSGPSLASDPVECPFTQPGVFCGVAVAIEPFYPVNYYGMPGMSSQPNTSASVPMRITFGTPVSHFRITVNDPDFSGNQVVAAAGGAVAIPFDNQPGVLTTFDVYFPNGGITTVDLLPAPADHVWYTLASFSVDSAEIVVTCAPTPVVRGGATSCQAAPPAGALSLTVTEWRYISPELSMPIVRQAAATTWDGPIAASGTVRVIGQVDGQPAVGEAPVTVTARNWSSKTVPHTVREISPQVLPNRPTRVGELGAAGNISQVIPPLGSWTEIPSGPNQGVLYFLDVPVVAESQIHINRVALQVGSDFYYRQPTNAPSGKCRRSDVVPFLPLVEAHEGLGLQAGSHAKVFRDALNNLVPQTTESPVSLGDQTDLESKAEAASAAARASARSIADDVQDGGTVQPVSVLHLQVLLGI